MPPTHLPRYLTYSSLFHLVCIAWLVLSGLGKGGKVYYTVDFLGGGAPAGGGGVQMQEKAESKPVEKRINPEEDLLLKSKKKPSKKEKEVVSTAAPIPAPPVQKLQGRGAMENVSVIPGAEGGVGIGIGEGGGGTGAGNFPYVWYVHSMKKKLDANWNVSPEFGSRIYAQVAFSIRKDGSIADVKMEESSKNEVFDRAALRAVEYAAPLPPLPGDFQEAELRVHVRFSVKR